MTRSVTTAFRDSAESSNSTDVFLIFATISHSDLLLPVRINSDIVDYIYNGETYYGTAFTISLLSDDENPPKASVSIPNISASIGESVLSVTSSPRIKIELLARSDFNSDIPRRAISTPTVEYSAPDLFLRNVTCDALAITADLYSYDISTEPWPKIRSTPDLLPGLFR